LRLGLLAMIDRDARAKVRLAVDDYFSDRISAFEFDTRLSSVATTTHDATVQFVANQLWYIYDDCDDHLVAVDKATWNTIQRFMLLLDSGSELRFTGKFFWHGSQCIAASTLLAIGVACWDNINAWPIPVVCGGIVSMMLAKWRDRLREAIGPSDPRDCWPFPDLAAIRRAWDATPVFRKQRFRSEVADRTIRSDGFGRALHYQFLYSWLINSPIALFFQSLPLRSERLDVDTVSASGRS
jgi:hypothetical protein